MNRFFSRWPILIIAVKVSVIKQAFIPLFGYCIINSVPVFLEKRQLEGSRCKCSFWDLHSERSRIRISISNPQRRRVLCLELQTYTPIYSPIVEYLHLVSICLNIDNVLLPLGQFLQRAFLRYYRQRYCCANV